MTVTYVIMALCVILGVPFTLWWWREADKWAEKEHKRFKPKADDSLRDAIVVKWDQRKFPAENPPESPDPGSRRGR